MKKIIFVIILFLGTLLASAQDLSTLILSMPDNIIMGLETDQKLALSGKATDTATVKVQTAIYDNIVRTAFNEDYIALKTSDAGTTQIKLLPLINDSKIICVIKTVHGEISDSQISFYTTKWIPIPQTNLLPPKSIDWFLKSGIDRNSQDYINATTVVDILPIELSFKENGDNIIATFDIKGYLSERDYQNLQPFLNESPRVFQWDKISYK